MVNAVRLLLVGSALSLALSARAAEPAVVSPGLAAPKMDVKTWYKGTPVGTFAKDKTYVVEFWATWCGPCKTSIPHLTELAKKNKDVQFVGISIWEDDKDGNIKSFVDTMGAKMDYAVGYSGNQEGMAQTWMTAAGQNGIPTAFVIKGGKVQWVGHPMELDKPLGEIKAGTYDLAAFKTKFDKESAEAREQMAASKAINAAAADFTAGKRAEAKAALDATVAKYPSQAETAGRIRFGWLAAEDPAAWSVQAKAMAATKDPAKVQSLATFAMSSVRKPETQAQAKEAIALALDASERKDFMVLYYASNVYATTKDDALALEVTNAMLAMYDTSPAKDSKELKEKLVKDKATLEAKLAAAKGSR